MIKKIFIFIFFYSFHAVAGQETKVNHFKKFQYQQVPHCQFEYYVPPQWEVRVKSEGILEYHSEELKGVRYETHPLTIAVIPLERVTPERIKAEPKVLKNKMSVNYKLIFLSGFERHGYLFQKGEKQIIVLPPEDNEFFNKHKDQVWKSIADSFSFN